jgi:hypothetical protein
VTVAVGGSAEGETPVCCSTAGEGARIGIAAGAAGEAAAGVATVGGTPPVLADEISARARGSLKIRSWRPRTTSFLEMAVTVKSRM